MSISSYNQQEVSTWPLSDAGALTSIFNYMNYKTELRGRGFKSVWGQWKIKNFKSFLVIFAQLVAVSILLAIASIWEVHEKSFVTF